MTHHVLRFNHDTPDQRPQALSSSGSAVPCRSGLWPHIITDMKLRGARQLTSSAHTSMSSLVMNIKAQSKKGKGKRGPSHPASHRPPRPIMPARPLTKSLEFKAECALGLKRLDPWSLAGSVGFFSQFGETRLSVPGAKVERDGRCRAMLTKCMQSID